MKALALPDRLAEWVRAQLGDCRVHSWHGRAGSDTSTWRLWSQRRFLYLKAHQRWAKWNMEVHAYERWAHVLSGQVPQLVAASEPADAAILLTEIPGIPVEGVALPAERESAVWFRAGAALACLHALPHGTWFGPPSRDGSPLATVGETGPVAMIDSTLAGWHAQTMANELLTMKESAIVRGAMANTSVFEGEKPIASHGDYRPRNWLVAPGGTWCGVIDFEHARWDLQIADLGNWWDSGRWLERPQLRADFLAGYGPLSERQREQLRIVRVAGALARIRIGHLRGDPAARDLGHRALESLRDAG
jgi:Ser/Thr protein kinase RdoA (MazF antagonist)